MATLARRVIAQTSKPSATGIPTRELGRTGERVSIVCLGGWHIRSIKDDAESIRVMHAAIDEGLTLHDWIVKALEEKIGIEGQNANNSRKRNTKNFSHGHPH